MPRKLRTLVYAVFALLWVSGILWLVLHYAFPLHTDFGPGPNPFEALVMQVHGLSAVGGVFLLGWLGAEHISSRWGRRGQRISGYVLTTAAALLSISGYLLDYSTGSVHGGAALLHEVLGAAAVLLALAHWKVRGQRRRSGPTAHASAGDDRTA